MKVFNTKRGFLCLFTRLEHRPSQALTRVIADDLPSSWDQNPPKLKITIKTKLPWYWEELIVVQESYVEVVERRLPHYGTGGGSGGVKMVGARLS